MTLEDFTRTLASLEPDELEAMLTRRHPEYDAKLGHWTFLNDTYQGGRNWFSHNLFKYIKEGDDEFQERVARAYRFNHTREVVDLVNKYIFKAETQRREEDAPEEVKRFWSEATLSRRDITEAMKVISSKSSIYGKIWVCVDTNQTDEVRSVAEEKQGGVRVYSYLISPKDLLDVGYDEEGNITWVVVRENVRQDRNPWSTGATTVQYRVWTTQFWALFNERWNKATRKIEYELVDTDEHNLGEVPVFPVDHIADEDLYSSSALIDDVAYLDRAVANYLSNLDAIIQDQTFSQLIMPAQSMMPGDDGKEKLLETGTKRIFTYDGDAKNKPEYISPNPSQAQLILQAVEKIISEIYHSTGLAGERTKQDNSMGIDNSSGVAKAYDFHKMNAMLASKANSLEKAEKTMMRLVMLWHGKTLPEPENPFVEYPEDFDVRSLADELEIAQSLALVSAPKSVRRLQMARAADKLLPTISDADRKEMHDEIEKDWLEEPDLLSTGNGQNPPTLPSQENRQGQVTEDTE